MIKKWQKEREREYTADDWKALYFVYQVFEQVALHGKPALVKFTAAMAALADRERDQ